MPFWLSTETIDKFTPVVGGSKYIKVNYSAINQFWHETKDFYELKTC